MAFLNESGLASLFTVLKKIFVRTVNGKAIDSNGNIDINDYVTELSVDGSTVTYSKKDGTSGTITTQDTTYNNATASSAGLMSSDDKSKLDGLATVATSGKYSDLSGKPTIDTSMSSTSTNAVQNKVVNTALGLKAPLDSPALTGVPTAPTADSSTNNTQIATTAYVNSVVNSKIASADAMIYKGTLGTGGTVTSLPAKHSIGWTYKVITEGTYAGAKCEVGDMVICLTEGTSSNDSHWTVIQTNVDGAVTGPASSVVDRVVIFSGTTGKVIKDSGFTIAKSVPSDAKFTDTVYTHPASHPASMITGLSTVATSGSYGDLSNKPTINKEAYLEWGGKNISGNFAPIDASMVPELGANRLAFMPANSITVEYSRNSGTSWTIWNVYDNTKVNLFTEIGSGLTIGGDNSSGIDKSQYQVRVTVDIPTANVYTELNKFVIYVTTNGSSGCYCTVSTRSYTDYSNNNDSWSVKVNKASVSGWSGYNVINLDAIRVGNQTYGNIRQLRFTFGVTSHASTVQYGGLQVLKILGFGGVGWSTPSTMAKYGRIYTYDSSQNVTFPAKVSATSFNGYTIASSVPANAKFTDTTYAVATQSDSGLLSSADKVKLDGIATGANKYVHPTTAGNKHIPSGGSNGQVLEYGGSSGIATWGNPKVRYGVSIPEDLQIGEMFIKVVDEKIV